VVVTAVDRNAGAYLKRVIAIPGDTIEGKNGQIILNNIPIRESYIAAGSTSIDVSSSGDQNLKKLYTFGPVIVEAGRYFLVGDNRGLSLDSRLTGPVDLDQIRGKAVYIAKSSNDSRDGKRLD